MTRSQDKKGNSTSSAIQRQNSWVGEQIGDQKCLEMCFCPLNLPQCTSDGQQPVQSGVFPVTGHDQTTDSSSHNPVLELLL